MLHCPKVQATISGASECYKLALSQRSVPAVSFSWMITGEKCHHVCTQRKVSEASATKSASVTKEREASWIQGEIWT